MSSRRRFLGVLVTTGSLTLGGSALMGYSLDPPNYSQGVTILNVVPPSSASDTVFTAGNGDHDSPMDRYVIQQESPGSDSVPMQPTWIPAPSRGSEHDRGHNA